MKKLLFLFLSAVVVSAGGCRSIMQGVAEEPYLKAMKEGRMSPAEYRKQTEEIRKASEASR